MKKLIILAVFLLLFPVVSHADCTVVVGGVATSETCTVLINETSSRQDYWGVYDDESYQEIKIATGKEICKVVIEQAYSSTSGSFQVVLRDSGGTPVANGTSEQTCSPDATWADNVCEFTFATNPTSTADMQILLDITANSVYINSDTSEYEAGYSFFINSSDKGDHIAFEVWTME